MSIPQSKNIAQIKASNESDNIESLSLPHIFSSPLEMKTCFPRWISLATCAKVSSLTKAILYKVSSDSGKSGCSLYSKLFMTAPKIPSHKNSNLSLCGLSSLKSAEKDLWTNERRIFSVFKSFFEIHNHSI